MVPRKRPYDSPGRALDISLRSDPFVSVEDIDGLRSEVEESEITHYQQVHYDNGWRHDKDVPEESEPLDFFR